MTESERCKKMMGECNIPKSTTPYRVSLSKNLAHMDAPWEVKLYCAYGWMSTQSFADKDRALDILDQIAESHNLDNVGAHKGSLTYYRF